MNIEKTMETYIPKCVLVPVKKLETGKIGYTKISKERYSKLKEQLEPEFNDFRFEIKKIGDDYQIKIIGFNH